MKIQPNEMPDALSFALRLTEISRWGIVATSRQQSVGEHSYRVCMIALAMYDYMENGTPHNSYDRNAVAALSMVHDIFEVLSGDVDSIFKIAMKAQHGDLLDRLVGTMAKSRRDTSALYDVVAAQERACAGTIVEAVVKLSDMVEALIYLDTYGTNSRHAQHVRDNILRRLADKYLQFSGDVNLSRYDWKRVLEFLNEVLGMPGIIPFIPTVAMESQP